MRPPLLALGLGQNLSWRCIACIYSAAAFLCAIYLFSVFLNIPVNTEARDYVYFHGYLENVASWWSLVYPAGTNQRIVSLLGFALSRDACGFHAPCLNTIQILELLGCFAIGTLHLHQLLQRPLIIACCMLVWTLSPPVFMAGFWQATQHDKLAFLFALSALSLGLWAIRSQKLWGRLITSVGVTALFILAINAKEISFFLPAAALGQILFLTPEHGVRGRAMAASVYALPGSYAAFYMAIYVWHLSGAWHHHVLSGDLGTNITYYSETLTGSRPSFEIVLLSMIGLLCMSCVLWIRAGMHWLRPAAAPSHSPYSGFTSVTLYLAAIFLASLSLCVKAQYPSDYYLLVTDWAFVGWIAANIGVAQQSGAALIPTRDESDTPVRSSLRAVSRRRGNPEPHGQHLPWHSWIATAQRPRNDGDTRESNFLPTGIRYGILAALCVLGIGFVVGRYNAFWVDRESGELIHEAKRISAGYRVLSAYCGVPMQHGLKLVFVERPAGAFYFFRGGGEGNDPRLGSFICTDGPPPVMAYSFDGDATPTQPGQLVAIWNSTPDLSTIVKDANAIYQKHK